MDQDALYEKFGRFFPAGSVLFEQGDAGKEMFILCSGKVQISRHVGDKETVLAVLPAGEFLGEMAIIDNQPRSATALVVEDARVLVIDSRTFEAMIRGSSEIAVRFIKKLAARLEATGRQVEALLFRDPNSRVVHCLRQEAERAGVPHPAGIAVEMDEKALAERLGLTLDEVSTVIGRLERAHLITRTPEGLFVVAEVGKLQDFLDFLDMKQRFSK